MTEEQNKQIESYIGSIKSKDVNGTIMYKIVTEPIRLMPLGYFNSEEEAKDALGQWLLDNGKI